MSNVELLELEGVFFSYRSIFTEENKKNLIENRKTKLQSHRCFENERSNLKTINKLKKNKKILTL